MFRRVCVLQLTRPNSWGRTQSWWSVWWSGVKLKTTQVWWENLTGCCPPSYDTASQRSVRLSHTLRYVHYLSNLYEDITLILFGYAHRGISLVQSCPAWLVDFIKYVFRRLSSEPFSRSQTQISARFWLLLFPNRMWSEQSRKAEVLSIW